MAATNMRWPPHVPTASGVTVADALGEVVALRRAWVGLATARRPTRPPALPARSARRPSLDTVCRVGVRAGAAADLAAEARALLAAVTAHCRYEDAGVHGSDGISTLEAWRVGGRYLLFQDHRHLLTTDNLMLARSELLRWLVLASHPERAWLAILHGSAVAGPNGAALLCGTSGAGKSTLTGFLLASGLDLVTDDYAPLEAGSQRLWPVPFGLSVKEGSWPLLRTPLCRPRDDAGRSHPAAPPALCPPAPDGDRAAAGAMPRLPALPARGRRRADRTATGRGAGALCTQRRLVRELRASGWPSSRAGSRRKPAYALSYGDTAGAVAAVRRLLAARARDQHAAVRLLRRLIDCWLNQGRVAPDSPRRSRTRRHPGRGW